ncbi:MAG: cupin domain-containing protein [Acholeplasmatales bacterium]|jgi:transcriptional regulator with XRE-family HTH domain|nr:cupin domain-containing protein [Acholeplasmataceae bacterium]MDY0115528.1 cupin domain-containing protein [Acholeplasmatales bacterium]MCK9234002.1 cupin domain-containing protein [Acholeplasmataceae bacterium]MCK9289048.1 cupin domain-containing protein [Acholeplasmataceae bacterium]MCK9427743.1 cupin domain-containing protein [Acholeplasmataceae bacterium]
MDIGSKIKQLRLENGLTQQELANRLELTKGYISQIERNISSPSMETFFSLLDVLGTNPGDFFDTNLDDQVVHGKEDFFIQENEALKHVISWIVPNALKYEMEPIIIEIEPGGQSSFDNPHAGEEFGYLLEGEIILVLNKKRYIIKKGESFYYLANKEHYLINASDKVAKVLWVSTPPMF